MDEAIVILAGGQARRFPGKLEFPIEGKPIVVRIFEQLRGGPRPVYVAGKGTFPPPIDASIQAPLIVDRQAGSGPLSALFWACTAVRAKRIFAVAADQPYLNSSVLDNLSAARQPGDEAVVPEHEGQMEPLAAIYDRVALLERGLELRRRGGSAMHQLLALLATRRVPMDGTFFHNVNRITDLRGEAERK